MAPRGPRKSGSQRANQAASSSAKTTRGIQKRRSTSRTDIDGDLEMDGMGKRVARATATETRSSRTKSARGVSGRNPQTVATRRVLPHSKGNDNPRLPSRDSRLPLWERPENAAWLRVYGLKQSKAATNDISGLNNLLAFLERKASRFRKPSRPVNITTSYLVGDFVFTGTSKEDADELIKLNTFSFAGTQLEIVESSQELAWLADQTQDLSYLSSSNKATKSEETQELRAKLQSILSQRYIGANKLLKLDSLASDADFMALGAFEGRERALKTFKVLMAICDGLFKTAAEKRDAIESITLANNAINDVWQVESLATAFPQLKNLDLSNNQIVSMQELEKWRGKFKSLETIYMTGNPIMAADPHLASRLLEWFPNLQDVNGVQLRAMIAELSRRTSMVPEYSEVCLSQVDWNFDKALIVFEEEKAQLPQEAFATPM